MMLVLILLVLQGILGAYDTLVHHEAVAKLPASPWAREELALHAAREALYVIIFLTLPWLRWQGLWALVLAGLLLIEIAITLRDFLVEDQTRRLAHLAVPAIQLGHEGVHLAHPGPGHVRGLRIAVGLRHAFGHHLNGGIDLAAFAAVGDQHQHVPGIGARLEVIAPVALQVDQPDQAPAEQLLQACGDVGAGDGQGLGHLLGVHRRLSQAEQRVDLRD